MNKLANYFKEAFSEFKKVTWPTRKQAINYSLLVIGISIFLAAFIGLADFLLTMGVEKVLPAAAPTQAVTQPAEQPAPIAPADIQVKDVKGNPVQVQTTPTTTPTK